MGLFKDKKLQFFNRKLPIADRGDGPKFGSWAFRLGLFVV